MKLLGRRKRVLGAGDELSEGQQAWALRTANRIQRTQRRLADRLNGMTSGFSVRLWCWLFFSVGLVWGGYCLYLIVAAFN